jgi:hypothetical protein
MGCKGYTFPHEYFLFFPFLCSSFYFLPVKRFSRSCKPVDDTQVEDTVSKDKIY